MGFHKRYVPDLKTLKQQYEDMCLDDFVFPYINADALIGEPESMKYLGNKIKEYREANNKIQNKSLE